MVDFLHCSSKLNRERELVLELELANRKRERRSREPNSMAVMFFSSRTSTESESQLIIPTVMALDVKGLNDGEVTTNQVAAVAFREF